MKNNRIAGIIAGALGGALLLSGCSGSEQNLGIQGELRDARIKLNANYTGSQSEMTMVSEFQLTLAAMELQHLRYSICNQSNYDEIEQAFQKDEQAWEALCQQEQEKPSEFAGGSRAPMDHNMRMTAFLEKRIAELKSKWCADK